MSKKVSRRQFGKQATAVGIGLASGLVPSKVLGANERVRLGVIGVGNRGDQVLRAFLEHKDQEVVALCDVYRPYLEKAVETVGGSPRTFKDYRRLLELKDMDAVVIATPDHWHALQFIDACNAEKDVYVEKPLSLTISEGRKMVETAKRTNRVVQLGTQQRSSAASRGAAEFVRNGGIGKVTVAKCYHVQNEYPEGIGNPPDCPPPEDLDWDLWLGPAPKVPYNPNLCHYKFRWFWSYSGGQLTNFGTHFVDVIQWALGKDAPQSVAVIGGKYAVQDNREIPDTLEAMWEYDGGTLVTFSQINCNAAPQNTHGSFLEFRGTKGTLYLGYDGYEVVPEEWNMPNFCFENPKETPYEVPARSPRFRKDTRPRRRGKRMDPVRVRGEARDADHARNFLDCVKSRKQCNAPIEVGHRSTSTTLLGNIALRTKSLIEWDARTERVKNNEKANRLLSYQYRLPWKLA